MSTRIVAPYVKPKAVTLTGTGPPSGTPDGGVGSLYVDTSLNWVYIYQTTIGWQVLNPDTKYRANTLYSAFESTNVNNSSAMGNNSLRVLPKLIKTRVVITALQLTVATAGQSESGGICRMCVFADSGDGKTPGSLLSEATTVSVDSQGDKEGALPSALTLNPGLYWFGGVVQNCPATRPNCNVPGVLLEDFGYIAGGLVASGVTGPIPSTFPSYTVGSTYPPLVRFRTQT